MSPPRISNPWLIIGILVVVKLLLHFTTNTNYELHRDAYLYLALSDHLDFGFMSVPPLIAVIGAFTQAILGDSVFAIRLLPALVGAASLIFIGLMVKELGGGAWASALAGLAFLLSPAFLRSNTLFQPVAFNQFFWVVTCYLVIKLIRTQSPKYWLYLGAVCGIAFLNKYSIAFLATAFLFALLLTPHRRLLWSRACLFGFALGFLIILPNLFWQHAHNWPVVTHMRELQASQLVHVQLADFISMQFLMNVHAVFVWLPGLAFLLLAREARQWRVLGYAFLILLAILLTLSGKAYYTLGIYPMLFAAGGVTIERFTLERLRWLKLAIVAWMVAIAVPIIPYSLPVLSFEQMAAYARSTKPYGLEGALRWEDGTVHALPQDYADMTGWRELADIVIRAYESLNAEEREHCMIFAENYGEAGAIRYYGRKHGLPEPVSFSGSFLFWAPDSIRLSALIYVDFEMSEEIAPFFGEIELVGEIRDPFARERGVKVFLCRKPAPSAAAFYTEFVHSLKRHLR